MAYTTQNMGLTVWNSVADLFSHVAMENNWIQLDQHNHTQGEGNQIPTGGIANGAVTSAKIAAGAVTATQLATSLVNSFLPSGVLLDFAGAAPPTGFLLCDGTAYQQSAYPNLATAIGTTYNIGGEASGYFRVPDHRGLVSVGATVGGGSAPGLASGISTRSLGPRPASVSGGEETHSLLAAESGVNGNGSTGASVTGTGATGPDTPDHSHNYGFPEGTINASIGTEWPLIGTGGSYTVGGATVRHAHTVPSLSIPALGMTARNADAAHNNMPPFIVVTKIIKY